MIFLIPVAIILTIVGVLIYRRRKRIIPITREIPVKEEQPVRAQERELPKIIYCSSCGVEILDITRDFCSECGVSLK